MCLSAANTRESTFRYLWLRLHTMIMLPRTHNESIFVVTVFTVWSECVLRSQHGRWRTGMCRTLSRILTNKTRRRCAARRKIAAVERRVCPTSNGRRLLGVMRCVVIRLTILILSWVPPSTRSAAAKQTASSKQARVHGVATLIKPNTTKNTDKGFQELDSKHKTCGEVYQGKNDKNTIGYPATSAWANGNLSLV